MWTILETSIVLHTLDVWGLHNVAPSAPEHNFWFHTPTLDVVQTVWTNGIKQRAEKTRTGLHLIFVTTIFLIQAIQTAGQFLRSLFTPPCNIVSKTCIDKGLTVAAVKSKINWEFPNFLAECPRIKALDYSKPNKIEVAASDEKAGTKVFNNNFAPFMYNQICVFKSWCGRRRVLLLKTSKRLFTR